MKHVLSTLLACLSLTCFAANAKFPDKPLTLVVPYTAGGGVDYVGRILATGMGKALGQSVIVENRPGAGGTIGAAYVAHSAADGYTMLVGGTGPLAVGPVIYPNLTYKVPRDLTTVSLVVLIPQILVVNPATPVKSVQDLIVMARARPGTMTMGVGGRGTGQDLSASLLTDLGHIVFVTVPYKGTSAALSDLLGGHIDMLFGDPSIIPSIKAGQLRALAVTTPTRSPSLPDVPTMQEAGVKDYVMQSFYALTVPAATPGKVVQVLNQAVARVLSEPDTQSKFAIEGMIASHDTPEHAKAFIAAASARAAKLLSNSDSHTKN